MKRLTIRNIPDDIYAEFEKQASINERSMESHARYIVTNAVTNKIKLRGSEMYQQELTDRLNYLMSLVKNVPTEVNLHPALLAERLGEENPLNVMNWFSGHATPDFKQIEHLAQYTGCNPEWLKFGTNRPFPIKPMQRINIKGEGYSDALNLLEPGFKERSIQKINIMRMNNEAGNILILREFENSLNTDFFMTNLHLSEQIGNTGFHDLCDFFSILQNLYLFYTNNSIFIKSYDLNENSFKYYFEERDCHPLKMLKECAHESVWWEDIWHKKMLEERNAENNGYFWPNDKQLIDRIILHLNTQNRLLDCETVDLLSRYSFGDTSEKEKYILKQGV